MAAIAGKPVASYEFRIGSPASPFHEPSFDAERAREVAAIYMGVGRGAVSRVTGPAIVIHPDGTASVTYTLTA